MLRIIHGNAWGAQPCPFHPPGPYLDALENVLEGPRDDASLAGWVRQALHGEGLPAACLAVGKDGAVVALGDALCGRTQTRAQLAELSQAWGQARGCRAAS